MTGLHFRDDYSTYRKILDICHIIESELHMMFSKKQLLLLIEKGTVEGLLTVLQGRPIKVDVTYNSKQARRTNLRDSASGQVLVLAQTEINTPAIPPEIMKDLTEAQLGIGEILTKHKVETRREIHLIGYEPKTESFYREYDIIVGGKVWFTIMESFSQLLYSSQPI